MQGRQWKSQPWTLSTCCFIIFNMFFINSVVMERCWNLCMRYYDLWLYKIKVGCATIEAQIQKALDSFSLNNCPQDPVLKRWHCPKNGAFWTVRVNHPPQKNWKKWKQQACCGTPTRHPSVYQVLVWNCLGRTWSWWKLSCFVTPLVYWVIASYYAPQN